jgi:hypothetical protein
MSDSEQSTLLPSNGKRRSGRNDNDSLSESTPLLSSASATPRYDGDHDDPDHHILTTTLSHHSEASSTRSSKKSSSWPSIIAMITLAVLAIAIMLGAFFVPAAVEEYAKSAAILEPTNLSLESITADGILARIEANFHLDAERVKEDVPRRIGIFTTWLVRHIGIGETPVKVYVPEYDNLLLGSASIPPLDFVIVNGHNNVVDFVAELRPGNTEVYRTIVNKWLDGKLDHLRVVGKANLTLNSGFIPLGTHAIAEALDFEGQYLYRHFASLYFGQKFFQ